MSFRDQFGNPVKPGRHYAVGRSRATGPICICYEDPDSGELFIRRKSGEPCPTRLYGEDFEYGIDPSTKFTLVDAVGCEVTDPSEYEDSISTSVKSAVLRARLLKDQLAGIESDLVQLLDAANDSELRDAILGAIHGDLGPDRVLELMGV